MRFDERRAARRAVAGWRFVVGLVAAATFVCPIGARADEIRYEVDVEAPANLKTLVESNLSLIRWRTADGRRGRIDEGQLRRLFDQGKDEIARLVATEGYYAPTIDDSLTQSGDRWIARYRIEPNTVTTVESVDVQFIGPILQAPAGQAPDLKDVRSSWTLQIGDVFRQSEWETNKRRALQALLITTYPFATLTRTEAQVDVRTSKAKLAVVIASGPVVRFGPIQIIGLARYPPETVRNIDPIDLGELYSQQKLFDFQQKLANTGYFSRVEVSIDAEADPGSDPRSAFVAPKVDATTPVTSPVPTEASAASAATASPSAPPSPLPREVTLPVRVLVEENKSKTLSAGIGYTTNSGPRGTLAYNIIDFLGGAKQLRTNLSIDRLNQTLGSTLLFPTTQDGYDDSIATTVGRQNIQNEVDRTGTISGKRAWGPDISQRYVSLDYIYEQKDIPDLPLSLAETLGVTYGVTLRRTDNLLTPTSGYIVSGQAGVGIRVNNGQPFSRLYGKGVRYQPIGTDNTLILRAEIGLIAGHDTTTLPSTLLFRAGGDGSVRGYGYQSLGVQQGGAISGARYLTTGTVEIDHWLSPRWPQWGVAAFVDAGNAANTFAELSPVVGYGVGGRWRSPVGTLDLDVAHGIQNGTTRIHFSLGVSF